MTREELIFEIEANFDDDLDRTFILNLCDAYAKYYAVRELENLLSEGALSMSGDYLDGLSANAAVKVIRKAITRLKAKDGGEG